MERLNVVCASATVEAKSKSTKKEAINTLTFLIFFVKYFVFMFFKILLIKYLLAKKNKDEYIDF